jgi:hydrogenase nickel incorporation protein HypB
MSNSEQKVTRIVKLEKKVLSKNDEIALRVRNYLNERKIAAINIISSPGSGKTTLLEKTLSKLQDELSISIMVGDQKTDNDARRLSKFKSEVYQINTHNSCHLNAEQVEKNLEKIIRKQTDLFIIENIGNLVCPSSFDLGEDLKVALLSCTEGEDKPIKYPSLFFRAKCVLITKSDLIPHLDWDEQKCREYIKRINNTCQIIKISSKNNEGMDEWYSFLRSILKK